MCHGCSDRKEAAALMATAEPEKEIIDLCRWLMKGKQINWTKAMEHAAAVKHHNAESVRLIVFHYFAKTLLGTKDDKRARFTPLKPYKSVVNFKRVNGV